MKRVLSWLIALELVLGIAACDKKERVPLPKTGASEVKQQAKEVIRTEVETFRLASANKEVTHERSRASSRRSRP